MTRTMINLQLNNIYYNKITQYNWQNNKIQMAWLTGWLVICNI